MDRQIRLLSALLGNPSEILVKPTTRSTIPVQHHQMSSITRHILSMISISPLLNAHFVHIPLTIFTTILLKHRLHAESSQFFKLILNELLWPIIWYDIFQEPILCQSIGIIVITQLFPPQFERVSKTEPVILCMHGACSGGAAAAAIAAAGVHASHLTDHSHSHGCH